MSLPPVRPERVAQLADGEQVPVLPLLLWPEEVEQVKDRVEENNPGTDFGSWRGACSLWEAAGWDYDRLEEAVRNSGNSREAFHAVGDVLPFLWEANERTRAVRETADREDDRALIRGSAQPPKQSRPDSELTGRCRARLRTPF